MVFTDFYPIFIMMQQILFYILFLLFISVLFVFYISSYSNRVIIEGKTAKKLKKGIKSVKIGNKIKKLGNKIKNITKTIVKKLNNNLNPMKLAKLIKEKRRAKRNRARNRRIQKYIRILNSIYDYSVSGTPVDYLQIILNNLKKLYVDNYNVFYSIWGNVKPLTRTYLKEKYKRFLEIKKKILDNINIRKKTVDNKILISSYKTFDLSIDSTNKSQDSIRSETGSFGIVAQNDSDYSKNIFNQAKQFINQIRDANSVSESFTDFLGNSDNGQKPVTYYVNLYDQYADSAYFKSYDKIENVLKKYETFFNRRMYEIKRTIDGIKQGQSIENGVVIEKGQTLHYLNSKLEFFYTILNTIEQKTPFGIILMS